MIKQRFISKVLSSFTLIFSLAGMQAASAVEVVVAFVGDQESSAYKGAKQGLDEANLQGQFLGQSYTLEAYAADQFKAVKEANAILAAVDAESLLKLAETYPETPIFNITESSDSVRDHCFNQLFHVIPSEKMGKDAIAQYLEKNPDAKVEARAWNDKFKKYAAGQVNNRYFNAFSLPMDDSAFAGWMAVKIISDAVARTNGTDSAKTQLFLRDELRIDGAKGTKMTFRPNGQLRQIVLLVTDGKVVGEAPVRGVASDLDSLGNVECTAQ